MKLRGTLHRGVLLRRYKRFLADVRLDSGVELTVHCANPGSMKGLLAEGAQVVVSDSGDPKRKLPFSLERIRVGRAWVGVNTALPNHIAREAIEAGRIEEVTGYETVRSEVKLGEKSRIDLRLEDPTRPNCWVEVKNVTLREGRAARFPDSVTERGRKHLRELAGVVERGERGVMLFLVNRADCDSMGPADDIDPAYGAELRRVADVGVELLAYSVRMRADTAIVAARVPVLL